MSTMHEALTATLTRRDADELAAAREEQRACDIAALGGDPCEETRRIRAAPLGATPLADRIKALEADAARATATCARLVALVSEILPYAADRLPVGPLSRARDACRVSLVEPPFPDAEDYRLLAESTVEREGWLEGQCRDLRADLDTAAAVLAAMRVEFEAAVSDVTRQRDASSERAQALADGRVITEGIARVVDKRTEQLTGQVRALRAQRDAAVSKLREVEALTGELTPEVWERLSKVQGYVRCGDEVCTHE